MYSYICCSLSSLLSRDAVAVSEGWRGAGITSHVSRVSCHATCHGLVTASIFHLPASILGQVKLSEGWLQRHAQFNASQAGRAGPDPSTLQ